MRFISVALKEISFRAWAPYAWVAFYFALVFLIIGTILYNQAQNGNKPASENALAELSKCGKKAASEVIASNRMVTVKQIKDIETACNAPSKSAQDQADALI